MSIQFEVSFGVIFFVYALILNKEFIRMKSVTLRLVRALALVMILAVKVHHISTAREHLQTTTPRSSGIAIITINASCVTPQRLPSSLTVSGLPRGQGTKLLSIKCLEHFSFPSLSSFQPSVTLFRATTLTWSLILPKMLRPPINFLTLHCDATHFHVQTLPLNS